MKQKESRTSAKKKKISLFLSSNMVLVYLTGIWILVLQVLYQYTLCAQNPEIILRELLKVLKSSLKSFA